MHSADRAPLPLPTVAAPPAPATKSDTALKRVYNSDDNENNVKENCPPSAKQTRVQTQREAREARTDNMTTGQAAAKRFDKDTQKESHNQTVNGAR